jgi:hypothetical protein
MLTSVLHLKCHIDIARITQCCQHLLGKGMKFNRELKEGSKIDLRKQNYLRQWGRRDLMLRGVQDEGMQKLRPQGGITHVDFISSLRFLSDTSNKKLSAKAVLLLINFSISSRHTWSKVAPLSRRRSHPKLIRNAMEKGVPSK